MITQYSITDSPNELNKTLGDGTQIESAKINVDEIDVLRPTFLCKSTELTGNYIHISELSRYYFIESKIAVDNTHTLVYCHVDVLMTWNNEIRNATGKCVMSQDSNPYYADTDVECRTSTRRISFDNAANVFSDSGMIVLVTSEG